MKKKFLSILLTLVLALSLCLVTAVPMAAVGTTTVTLDKAVDGIAEWSTTQVKSGSHSVYLEQVTPDTGSWGTIQMEVVPIPIAEFTGVSYFVWEPEGIQHGGQFPGNWNIPYPYGDPYIEILLDTDGNGVWDDTLHGTGSTEDGIAPEFDTPHPAPPTGQWVEMAEAYGFRDSNYSLNTVEGVTTPHEWGAGMVFFPDSTPEPHEVWRIAYPLGTLADWQGWFATNAPDVTVVGVKIWFGYWLDDPVMGVYVDGITIDGVLYDLEPATDTALMTATYPAPVIGIEVVPTLVDFGDLVPGTGKVPVSEQLTVTNTGDVAEDFSATLTDISAPDVYTEGLTIDTLAVSAWTLLSSVEPLAFVEPALVLTVPVGTPYGTYTGTLVFWAEMASPSP